MSIEVKRANIKWFGNKRIEQDSEAEFNSNAVIISRLPWCLDK